MKSRVRDAEHLSELGRRFAKGEIVVTRAFGSSRWI
jgi:hypothetical protein